MERNEGRIQMEFSKAKKQADEMESLAGKLEVLADTKLRDVGRDISVSWTGENANLYLKKLAQDKEKLSQTAVALKRAAQTLRENARRLYEAEMTALALADTRSYNQGRADA